MNKATSLKEFGYNFLGPICSEYFHSINEYTQQHQIEFVGFLAREGFLFEKIYAQLCSLNLITDIKREYVLASRSFLFRISIGDPYTWKWSLGHGFEGSLQKLLISRFGFTYEQVAAIFAEKDLLTEWDLPTQVADLEKALLPYLSQLQESVKDSKVSYIEYLKSLGIVSSTKTLLLDVGYSGTIQKLITRLLKIDTSGLYFITTKAGEYEMEGNVAYMDYVFKDNVKMGEGYKMLDRSLFLEALLTSSKGQFVDIRKNPLSGEYEFFYSRNAYTQQNIHELECIFDGAIEAVLEMFKNGVRYSQNEIEELYERYTSRRNMLPSATWPLFDVDDAISGNGNVDPLTFFGL
jgi:hypothetical protein